ncbi:hypothetical protein [Sphingomonas alba]|uniref:Uncharacterized protein n=1 Tax=Sphingomonas alba TaxID=2908208 RepID=A0ABT0RJM5_9SPHN|nr:hypothetical protein [Sphingomonas alba]MCL6682484.1 hypothetical protein [Sphingomonas alba]
MSCAGYTVRLDNGTELCLPRYREIVHWKKPDPDPKFRLFDDLDILAIINEGIGHLANEHLRKSLSEAVASAARSIELPKGVTLGDGFNQKAFMASK